MNYTIHCDYDEGFTAYIDEMPGAISQGDTLEATLVNLPDAVRELDLAALNAPGKVE